MKSAVILVGLASAMACSHNAPDADEPSVNYVEPSARAEDPLGGTSPKPFATDDAAGRNTTWRPNRNELGGLQPEQKASLNPAPMTGSAVPSASASTSGAPYPLPAAPQGADNTGVNKRDQNSNALTPLDQGNNQSDLNITQAIRKAVVGTDGLSFNAKNVKIITNSGRVTLRGPVKTAAERTSIAALARQTAGVNNVDDQLEVQP